MVLMLKAKARRRSQPRMVRARSQPPRTARSQPPRMENLLSSSKNLSQPKNLDLMVKRLKAKAKAKARRRERSPRKMAKARNQPRMVTNRSRVMVRNQPRVMVRNQPLSELPTHQAGRKPAPISEAS